jgi:hypothetical protein
VKTFRKILFIGFSFIYLFLSTGVILFQTHCNCSGQTNVSMYASQSPCEPESSDNGCCEEQTSCCSIPEKQESSCGCNVPEITFLKLTDHFAKDVNPTLSATNFICLLAGFANETFEEPNLQKSTDHVWHSPPDTKISGRFLINFIHQRKIALFA